MEIKRDCVMLAKAEEDGCTYVHFDSETGRIYGSSFIYPSAAPKYPHLLTLTLADYRFWTSRHKEKEITTAMDWYNMTDFNKIFGVANVHIL